MDEELDQRLITQGFSKTGKFIVMSGKLIVSDPGLEKGNLGQVFINRVSEGKWSGFVFYIHDLRRETKKIARMIVLNDLTDDEQLKDKKWQLKDGELVVENGCAGIFDEKFYNDPALLNEEYYNKTVKIGWQGANFGGSTWQNLAFNTVKPPQLSGDMPYGFIGASGHGNGGFPVSVIENNDALIVGVRIDFIFPDHFNDMNIHTTF